MAEEKKKYEPQEGEVKRLCDESGRSEEDCKAVMEQANGDYALARSLLNMRPAQGFKPQDTQPSQRPAPGEGEQPTVPISKGQNPQTKR